MTGLQVRFLASSTFFGIALIAILVAFMQLIGYEQNYSTIWIVLVLGLLSAGTHYLLGKKGETKWIIYLASVTLTLINILLVGMAIFQSGGIASPYIWIFSIIVVVDLLIKGYTWSIFTATASLATMISVELLLHWDIATQSLREFIQIGFLTHSSAIVPQFIFLVTIIALVRYAENARLFHDFGLRGGLEKTYDLRELLIDMVEPQTISETIDVVYKKLPELLEFDFVIVSTVQGKKIHFIYQKGLPKSADNYKTQIKGFPNTQRLMQGLPCLCDIQKVQACKKLVELKATNIIVSPILEGKKLAGLFIVGARNRKLVYTDADIELIGMITQQLRHVWKLQGTVQKLRKNERKLRKALREKRKLRALKSEFVSITSHQLRTPLSSMKWFLEMLLGGDFGKLNQEQAGALEQVSEANARMIVLINDMMEVARVEDGKLKARIKPTNINDIIQKSLEENRIIASAKNISLTYLTKEKTPKIDVDPVLFEQVVKNLISNGVKYTKARGRVEISAKNCGDTLEIAVKDTGIGMKKKDQEQIFKKFYRSEEVKKMATSGSGLGLYLSKAMIDIMDGKIWFKSQPGKGSTFYLSLPVSKKG